MRRIKLGGELVAVRGFQWSPGQADSSDPGTAEGDEGDVVAEIVVRAGDQVAKLILQTVDGELDHVVFDRDLAAFELTDDGEVVARLS